MFKTVLVYAVLIVAVIVAIFFAFSKPKGAPMTTIPESTPTPAAPEMTINADKTYTATLRTTEGDIVITLNAKQTPKTVNNFVVLARKGFYDKTVFHRVMKGFMIQGGDPDGTGRGGPGYRIPDEPVTESYTRGTVAMANTGMPNTGGSQFFIMHKDTGLDPIYTIFGHVTKGIEVVDKIATAETVQDGRENSTPVHPVAMESVTITEQ